MGPVASTVFGQFIPSHKREQAGPGKGGMAYLSKGLRARSTGTPGEAVDFFRRNQLERMSRRMGNLGVVHKRANSDGCEDRAVGQGLALKPMWLSQIL